MTDAAFREGMKLMAAVYPDRDEDDAVKATRGQAYRRILDYLTDAEWIFAVSLALQYEKWFPTPASLISYADEYMPTTKVLPAPRDMDALEVERAERRGEIKSGMELVRQELVTLGLIGPDAPFPGRSMR